MMFRGSAFVRACLLLHMKAIAAGMEQLHTKAKLYI